MTVLKILIVDDDLGDRRLARLALGEQAYECMVDEVDGAEAALEKLRQDVGGMDVVLLDGHLDGQLATFVIDEMRQDEDLQDIHIVVLTGSSNHAEHDEYIKHGADAVIEKQNDIGDLIKALSGLERYKNSGLVRAIIRQLR